VYRLFGLSRDPFAPVCDGELYWENQRRAAVREEATRALTAGRGVWLCGAPGTGRETLLARAVEELALAGRPVLWAGSTATEDPSDLLGALLALAGVEAPSGDLVDRAGAVYRVLLEGFSRGGPVVVVLPAPAGEGARVELDLLAQLRVAGKALVTLASWGEGEPPLDALCPVELPSLSPEELRSCLGHRASVCGRPDLLSGKALDAVVRDARGLGEAMLGGTKALLQMAFSGRRHAEAPGRAGKSRATPVLDRAALEEVGELLEGLRPGSIDLQKL
jgi:hypothetical protein